MLEDADKPDVADLSDSEKADRPSPESEKPLKLQIADLVEDARALAIAELEYYRTKLSINMAATKTVLTLFAISVTMGLTAIVALILGILLIVSSYLGPVAATGIVTGTTLFVTTILMSMAIKRARKLPLDENEK